MYWNGHRGWGHRRGPFSPFALLFGLFVLFVIFKSGLWLPLLLLGAFLWFMPAMRRYWHEGRREQMREWGEKAKRDWDEKPKRKTDDIEYV